MTPVVEKHYEFNFHLTSPLTKVLPGDHPANFPVYERATALRGDRVYFGAVLDLHGTEKRLGLRSVLSVDGELAPYTKIYSVDPVPVRMPHYPGDCDDDYVSHEPGLYPDLLRETNEIYPILGVAQQLYFEVNVPKNFAAGKYPLTVTLAAEKYVEPMHATIEIEVLPATIPAQEITCTQWMHYDCLADYYNVPVFSKRHWEIIESFVKMAVKNGMTALLTPIFTPPLDTVVGGERLTVQLLDITVNNGEYTFGFEKLKRFCKMAKRCGIKDLEMAHLFTQWGAEHAPKIMATVDGEYKKIFGWESDATGGEYTKFLRAMLPQLKEKLDEFGYRDHYFFHISDEPKTAHLENYLAARNSVLDIIGDHPVRDALSHYDFYEQGVISNPIPDTKNADTFVANNVPDLWVYYCCTQATETSNRFIAMNAHRTRVIGAQMYRAGVTGFLQWGFNFYYNRFSRAMINPFLVNDGDYFGPAGDPFSVYPAPDGTAISSLRAALFEQALFDMRAMKLAEKNCGREAVIAAIDKCGKVDFRHYPKTPDYLLELREQINRMCVKKK